MLVSAVDELTLEITTDPSPTEEATRLTDPARTSPTANMPGSEVAKGEGGTPAPDPVITNPLSSRSTSPESHSVFGDAPTRSEEHTSELQSLRHLVCRLL